MYAADPEKENRKLAVLQLYRSRFVFGCFGCQLTEEKCRTTEGDPVSKRFSGEKGRTFFLFFFSELTVKDPVFLSRYSYVCWCVCEREYVFACVCFA